MKVEIDKLGLNMEIHTRGMKLLVHDRKRLKGGLYITKSGLIWWPSKIAKNNGKTISWADFIGLMERKRK